MEAGSSCDCSFCIVILFFFRDKDNYGRARIPLLEKQSVFAFLSSKVRKHLVITKNLTIIQMKCIHQGGTRNDDEMFMMIIVSNNCRPLQSM